MTASPFNVTAAVDGGWRTERGCQCARPWSYYGSTHAEGQCANPDSDTVGTWCFLRADSCPVGISPAGTNWDYCARHPSPAGEVAGSWQGTVKVSGGGGDTCEMRMTNAFTAGGFATADVRCTGESAWRELYQEGLMVGRCFAVFQGTSNGGRQFLRNRRSNRHIVSLYGKSDSLFSQGLKFDTR